MKYLKYFEQASAYEDYKNGSDYITPNVSYIVEIDNVKYEVGKQEAKQITFTLSISSTFVDFGELTFTCNEGDTWADLVAKGYEGFSISDDLPYYTNENGEFGICNDGPEVNYAHSNEVIEDGKTYYAFRAGWA
jgi:hypothetical protein